jgi:hypothetical protein
MKYNQLFNKVNLFFKISTNAAKKLTKLAQSQEFSIEQLKDLNPIYSYNEIMNILNFMIATYSADNMKQYTKDNNLQGFINRFQDINKILTDEKDYNKMIPYVNLAATLIDNIAKTHGPDYAKQLTQKSDKLKEIAKLLPNQLPRGSTTQDYLQQQQTQQQPAQQAQQPAQQTDRNQLVQRWKAYLENLKIDSEDKISEFVTEEVNKKVEEKKVFSFLQLPAQDLTPSLQIIQEAFLSMDPKSQQNVINVMKQAEQEAEQNSSTKLNKEQIKELQRALNNKQITSPPLDVDGIIGPKTLQAIQIYKNKQKLPANTPDSQVLASLQNK